MRDIESRTDIDLLMRVFYEHALVDKVIGHIFTDVARLDIEEHLPIIGDFWDSVLFGATEYPERRRNPLEIHHLLDLKIQLTDEHFRRWLDLFFRAIDTEFNRARAEFLKTRARAITTRMLGYIVEARSPIKSAT